MKITLEFNNAEEFYNDLPKFAALTGFSGQFAHFTRGKKGDTAPKLEEPDLPEIFEKDDQKYVRITKEQRDKLSAAGEVVRAMTDAKLAKEGQPHEGQSGPTDPDPKKAPIEAMNPPEGATKPEPKPEEKPAEKAAEISEAEVKKALTWLARKDHKDDVRSILNAAGVRNFPELAKLPEKFPEVYKEATAKIKEYGGADND